jgi:hypothetical protein
MGRLILQSPAMWTDCLTCAGGRALARKAAMWMRSNGESVSISADGELLAVAYLVPDKVGRREFCLAIRPGARPYMRPLCRLAHSTLTSFSENGLVVFCHVMPGNRSGERMARLCGFRPVGGEWIFEGTADHAGGEGTFRRGQRQYREEGSGKEPAVAGGLE